MFLKSIKLSETIIFRQRERDKLMKKFLIRGGISPFDNFSPLQVLCRNAIGENSGNLLYAYGCYRSFFSDDVSLELDYYKAERGCTQKEIDKINREYDAYLIPLADAFRPDFKQKLRNYTALINKLKIPVYLLGVGIRAPYEPNLKDGFSFDKEVKDFIKAVLNHSAIVGLRGQITADYLKSLGFKEEKDFTVIGCPSMYSKGRHLPEIRFSELKEDSRISVNFSNTTPENVLEMIFSNLKKYPDYCFVGQNINDLRLLYTGINYKDAQLKEYPATMENDIFVEDRVRFFVNVPSWFSYMKERDITIGGRLHGNIAGVLCGCAPIFIPQDARMRELVEYHQFPSIPSSLVEPNWDFKELVLRLDLQSHIRQQSRNFDHFIEFLDTNGLEHIFKDDIERKEAPLDEKMDGILYEPSVTSIVCSSPEEAIDRCREYAVSLSAQKDALKKRNANLTEKLQISEKKCSKLLKDLRMSEQNLANAQELIKHPTKLTRYYLRAAKRKIKKQRLPTRKTAETIHI